MPRPQLDIKVLADIAAKIEAKEAELEGAKTALISAQAQLDLVFYHIEELRKEFRSLTGPYCK
jgi:hypothetical protein